MDEKYESLSVKLYNELSVNKEYIDDLINFYKDYFPNIDKLRKFIESVFSFKHNDINIPRLMINNTMRLAKLAEDMEKIRPGKDALKITYLVTCIDTLYKLSGKDNGKKDWEIVTDFFKLYLLEADKKTILSKVKISIADKSFELGKQFNDKINIETFASIINETRNIFVHEGDYWSNSLSHMDDTEIKTLYAYNKNSGRIEERVYEFKLKYEELHKICIRGFINFINNYMRNNNLSQ